MQKRTAENSTQQREGKTMPATMTATATMKAVRIHQYGGRKNNKQRKDALWQNKLKGQTRYIE